MTIRYQIDTDGLTFRPRYDRRYAVIDTARIAADGRPAIELQTDDATRARSFADELNSEKKSRQVPQ